MTEQEARDMRDDKLFACDWTQAADAPLTGNEQARWRTYRSQLRDITSQGGFPGAVVWPPVPEKDPPWIPAEPFGMVAP